MKEISRKMRPSMIAWHYKRRIGGLAIRSGKACR
jgi:hypothetical protein